MDIETFVANFEFLGDWDQRYAYITELGTRLPHMDDALKTEANRVQGCMSKVWVTGGAHPNDPRLVHLLAEGEGPIVQGLVALLVMIYQDKTPEEIASIDIDDMFVRLGLDEHLSPNRHIGMYAMVRMIQDIAQRVAASP
ncbi:MAG: SufE family protein [Gammaproteobacteria bacterium]|nr:SufE family protein [Gammaproteobacteria bacterium]